ncbi:MAG: hypothetical protein U0525_00310 [Patescibacteria group bacterium]
MNEEPLDAAKRIQKKQDSQQTKLKIGECFVAPGFSNLKCFYFLVENFDELNLNREESEEIIDQSFFTLDEINKMILDGQINDGPTITGLYYYILFKRNHA